MPLTANRTGMVEADGTWQRVCEAAETIVSLYGQFEWGLSEGAAQEPERGHVVPASLGIEFRELRIKTVAGQHLWIKAPNGKFSVTCTTPAI